MSSLWPLRFDRQYPETAEVPGQLIYRKQRNTPTNCRRLLKHAPPGPIEPTSYERPPELRPGRDPFPWQERGIRFGLPRQAANLWHVGGAGKSFTALWLALLHGGPILWVSMSRLRPTIAREVRNTTTLRPCVLEGRSPEKIVGPRLVVCGWEILVAWQYELMSFLGRNGTVIFDEIHMAKAWKRQQAGNDPETGRKIYRDIENISTATSRIGRVADRRLGLTATPVANDRSDLWAQLDDIEPDCWGDNWAFVHRYCDAKPGRYEGKGLDTSGKSNDGELNLRLREVCSIAKKSEVDRFLPPMRRELVYLSRTEQCRPPAGTSDVMKTAARRGANSLLEAKFFEASARKRKWIVDFVESRLALGHKICVFTCRRNDTLNLAEAIREQCPGVKLWWGHGEHDDTERDQMAEAYMNTQGPCVLVGTGDCFGTGMNLQDTDDAIFAMLPYTWKQLGQWEWRFTRPGQKRPVQLFYVVAEGTVDEDVVDLLLGKLDTVSATMGDDEAEGVASTLAGDMDDEAIMAKLLTKV